MLYVYTSIGSIRIFSLTCLPMKNTVLQFRDFPELLLMLGKVSHECFVWNWVPD